MRCTPVAGAFCLAFGLMSTVALAQPNQSARPIARNLDNPSGIAIQPGTGHIFVAQHGSVVRIYPREADGQGRRRGREQAVEVSGFPTDIYGKGPMYNIGPLGVAFLDASQLIVGDGSRPDGSELLRIYKVSSTPAEQPQKEDDAVATLGPIAPGDQSAKGEGNFYGIAVTKEGVFVTSNGDDTKGWILRAAIEGGKPGKLTPYLATKEKLGVDAPVGITVSPQGELVVGQMGEVNVAGDSLLTIYDPKTGELKKKYETGLSDIAGLAYSPESGKLYAVDFAWAAPKDGGLFELVISGDKCTARKVMELDKPTAIAFDEQGNAYIAVFGTAEDGSSNKSGQVIRVRRNAL